MGSYACNFPGRSFAPRIVCSSCSHVRNQHDLGCHLQRSRILKFLHRSSESAQEVQVQYDLCNHRYCRYDYSCDMHVYPTGLDDHRLCGDSTHGNCNCQPHASTDCTQSSIDDVLLVIDGTEIILIVGSTNTYRLHSSVLGNISESIRSFLHIVSAAATGSLGDTAFGWDRPILGVFHLGGKLGLDVGISHIEHFYKHAHTQGS